MHEFMHGCSPARLARSKGHGQLAGLPVGQTPGGGDNLHISLLLYRIYTEIIICSEIIIIWPLSVYVI